MPGTSEGDVTFIVAESGKRNTQHVVLVIFRLPELGFEPREGVPKATSRRGGCDRVVSCGNVPCVSRVCLVLLGRYYDT